MARNPCSLTRSQREPKIPMHFGSFGSGIKLFHICCTTGLMPRPRGSHLVVPFAPQLVPVFRLYCTPPKVRMPARMLADGTALSMVDELGQRNPS